MAGNGKGSRTAEAPEGMTRRAMYIEDELWAQVSKLRPLTVLDSNASFIRECVRVGAPRVARKYRKKG
jgi:hypothetical protein